MVPRTSHRLMALLCLVAFGLGQTVMSAVGVKCVDQSGQTRYEFSCVKATNGACLVFSGSIHQEPGGCEELEGTGDDHAQHAPDPCKDTRIGEQAGAEKLLTKPISIDPIQFSDLTAPVSQRIAFATAPSAPRLPSARAQARPPDSAARLRTIVMTV